MSSSAEYVGCAHENFDLPNRSFCHWLVWCLVDWMIEIWGNKTYCQFNNLFISQTGASVVCGRTIHSHNSLAPPPHVGHQPGHTLLWDGIPFFNQYLVIHCCEMTSHSSTSNCHKSANVVVLVTLARTARLSWSHKFSMGLSSGLLAGHSILSTPTFWR